MGNEHGVDGDGIRVQDHSLVEMRPFLDGRPSTSDPPLDLSMGLPPQLADNNQRLGSPPQTRITRLGSSPQLVHSRSKSTMGKQPHGQDKAIFPTTGGLVTFSLNHLLVLAVCLSFVVMSLLPFDAYSAHILVGCLSWILLSLSVYVLPLNVRRPATATV